MAQFKEDVKCPKCRKKIRIKVIEKMNEEHIESIINRSLFDVSCKECNETIVALYPFELETNNYLIYFDPAYDKKMIKDKNKKTIKRICNEYDDLKEKILIFEDKLNDVVIEFMKEFYSEQIDEKLRKKMTGIRYNYIDNNQIIFSILGTNQNIGCPYSIYEELYRRSKIKKIKYATVIDEYTYRKYFKMR